MYRRGILCKKGNGIEMRVFHKWGAAISLPTVEPTTTSQWVSYRAADGLLAVFQPCTQSVTLLLTIRKILNDV